VFCENDSQSRILHASLNAGENHNKHRESDTVGREKVIKVRENLIERK
jgi:hypothetical protein